MVQRCAAELRATETGERWRRTEEEERLRPPTAHSNSPLEGNKQQHNMTHVRKFEMGHFTGCTLALALALFH
jgi:hypothetical protein